MTCGLELAQGGGDFASMAMNEEFGPSSYLTMRVRLGVECAGEEPAALPLRV